MCKYLFAGLALVLCGIAVAWAGDGTAATQPVPATQPARKVGGLQLTPASASPLSITDKWILWQTHQLIPETRNHRAQSFIVNFHLQRRGEKRAVLAWTTRETNVRWKATVLDDGTLLLYARNVLGWISPGGKPRGGAVELDQTLMEVLTLHPDGIVVRTFSQQPIRAWFIPIKRGALAPDEKVPLTDEKGFRYARAPIHYKIVRHGDEFAWSDDAGLHIVNIASGARRKLPHMGHRVLAFDGKTVVADATWVDLRSGKRKRFKEHLSFVAVRNRIGYAVQGVEQAIRAYGHPKHLRLVAVDLGSGRQRVLAKWPNAEVCYIADRGPMGQAFEYRVEYGYAPVLFAAEEKGLLIWNGGSWVSYPWQTRKDRPATQPVPATGPPALTDAEAQRLEKLIADLKSNDPKTLDEAFQGLTAMKAKAAGAVDALAGMLADHRRITYRTWRYRTGVRTFQVSVSAVGVLRKIGKPAVPALVVALRSEDSRVRQTAARALAGTDEPIEAKHWIRALEDSDRHVQTLAARQLGELKDASAVQALCKALKDGDKDVRIEVAKALGQIGDKKAIGPLMAALSDEVNNVGYAAGGALARIGRPAVEALLERFERLDERERRAGTLAIWRAEPKQMKDLLVECLKSKHREVRDAATHALAKLKTAEAIQVVTGMLQDAHEGVRWTATRCLGEMADDRTAAVVRPVLLKVLKDDKAASVRGQALWSLYYLPDKPPDDFWKAVNAAMGDESPKVREAAASAALKFWTPRLAPGLIELLKDPEPRVRAEAAAALGRGDFRQAIPDLIRLLEDKNVRCTQNAAFALARMGTDKAVVAVIRTVRDARASVERRRAALYGLCHTKNPKAVGALIAALEDDLDPKTTRVGDTLKQLTGQDYGYDAAKWRQWYERQRLRASE